jgi:hypothetical protein
MIVIRRAIELLLCAYHRLNLFVAVHPGLGLDTGYLAR